MKPIERAVQYNGLMDLIRLILILENKLSAQLKQDITGLQRQCFHDMDPLEAEECFCTESFARLPAYADEELVGYLILHKRNIEFDGREILVGGAVGACVAEQMRRKGIGIRLMKKGVAVLKKEHCDVACLNADPINRRAAFELYKKLGFELMDRKISFEDTHGNVRYDTGTMFMPLCSKERFNHIMKNKETFHYGKGYW